MKKSRGILDPPSPALIERMFRIFFDTKKTLSFSKDTGTWAWVDSDEVNNPDSYHGGFHRVLDCIEDAVEPYLEDEEK